MFPLAGLQVKPVHGMAGSNMEFNLRYRTSNFGTFSPPIFVLSDKNSDFNSCYSCDKRGRNTLIYKHKKNSSSTPTDFMLEKNFKTLSRNLWTSQGCMEFKKFSRTPRLGEPCSRTYVLSKEKKSLSFQP